MKMKLSKEMGMFEMNCPIAKCPNGRKFCEEELIIHLIKDHSKEELAEVLAEAHRIIRCYQSESIGDC